MFETADYLLELQAQNQLKIVVNYLKKQASQCLARLTKHAYHNDFDGNFGENFPTNGNGIFLHQKQEWD